MSQIIKVEKNSIEYFTLTATGESGMSISGLARACGVDKSTMSRFLQGLLQSSPSEILEPFAGMTSKELTLLHNSVYHNATIIKDVVCAAILSHYASKGKIEAVKSVATFAAIGIRTYIQQITGYIQPQQAHLPQDYLSALKFLVAAEEEKQILTLKAAEQEQQIMELQPKAKVYEQVMSSSNYLSMGEVAKIINLKNMGRNKLFKFLKVKNILQADNQPYQQYVNAGYFKAIMKSTYILGVSYPVTVVSPKGVEFIISLLQKAGYPV